MLNRNLLTLCALLVFSTSFLSTSAQDNNIPPPPPPPPKSLVDSLSPPLAVVQTMPKFKGNLNKYLQDNIQYPERERNRNISGKVFVTFVVEKDGSITSVKLLRGVPNGPGLDSEAMAVIKAMPAWEPGMQNGHVVRVQFNIPIDFELRDNVDDSTKTYSIMDVNQWPKYPGGDPASYVKSHVPTSKSGDKDSPKVILASFTVEKDGTLSDITFVSGSDANLNAAVKDCMSRMGKWTPGMKNSKAVKVKYYLKIDMGPAKDTDPVKPADKTLVD